MKRQSCKHSSKVSAFVDHELLLTEGSAMENHLRSCSECQAQLEDVLHVRDRLRLLKTPDLPVPLTMRVELEPVQSKSILSTVFTRRITLPVPVALLLAALLLLPALFLALRPQKNAPASVVRVEVPVERIVVQAETATSASRIQQKRVGKRRPWPADNSSVATRLGNDPLQGFRPADTANIRVVKDTEH
jgi:anti-sigma factor RsiW